MRDSKPASQPVSDSLLPIFALRLLDADDLDAPRVRELAAGIARQRSTLRSVDLLCVPLDVEELWDALIACPLLTRLELRFTTMSRDALAGLARLLRADVLVTLMLNDMTPSEDLWESREAAMEFAAALRACTRLTRLELSDLGLLEARGSIGAEAAVLVALVGHPSLEELRVFNYVTDQVPGEHVGASLGALVAANTPALKEFLFALPLLNDADLLPCFTALPFNTHLRYFCIGKHMLSMEFMRDIALPAVRANASLRRVYVVPQLLDEEDGPHKAALRELDAQFTAALNGRGEW